MSEENKEATTETVSESPAKGNNQDGSNDYLIAESKKYRKRAQDAEARLAKFERKLVLAEEAKLKEKEDFKALYEKVSSENESLNANSKKWIEYEDTRRASLLEKHPEDDREDLSKLDLQTLEYVTSKINNTKPNPPEVIGTSKNTVPDKPWGEMTDEERRAFYTFKANQGNR